MEEVEDIQDGIKLGHMGIPAIRFADDKSYGILLVSALPNSGSSFLFMCTPLSVELPHGRGNTWEGACFRVLHTPHPNEGVVFSNFGGSGCGNMWEGACFRVIHTAHPNEGAVFSNFGGSFLFMRSLFVTKLSNLTW